MLSLSPLTLSNLLSVAMCAIGALVFHYFVKKSPLIPSQTPQQQGEDTLSNLPGQLFALLVGIDQYHQYDRLSGGAKDVNHMEIFLSSSMSVPEHRIKKLLDGAATRAQIINEIEALKSNTDIKYGDPILIYYAGYGTRSPAPEGYSKYAADGMLESICPVDISLPNAVSPVTGIPDVVLGLLISQLAVEKGDNITVILDCCRSANATRGICSNSTVRGINDPPQLSTSDLPLESCARESESTLPQANNWNCCVLLAACGRDEGASENSDGGLFTGALLKCLNDRGWNRLTYKWLIQLLEVPGRQHPHCEGPNSHRYLFRTETPDPSYIQGYRNSRGEYVLEAGKNFGLQPGNESGIHGESVFSREIQHPLSLKATIVDEEKSVFSPPDVVPASKIPNRFYARRTSFPPNQKIKFHASDVAQLNEVLTNREDHVSSFAERVETDGEADLLVSFEHRSVYFSWGKKSAVGSYATKLPIGHPIPVSRKDEIVGIFRAAAHFQHYLQIGEAQNSLELELWPLNQRWQKVNGIALPIWVPSTHNILDGDLAKITIRPGKQQGPFGLNICNFSEANLYPYVFWFEPRTLDIRPWFASQTGSPHALLPACTLHNGQPHPGNFAVGYGESNVRPWGFTIGEGDNVDVGFFKVIATRIPVDLTSLTQQPPFEGSSRAEQHGLPWTTKTNSWLTQTAIVVQDNALKVGSAL